MAHKHIGFSPAVYQGWFLWPLILAVVLECLGRSATFYQYYYPIKSRAAIFTAAPLSIAPGLVAISNFGIFYGLISWTVFDSKRVHHPIWQAVLTSASYFPVIGALPILLSTMGHSDLFSSLSPKPIESAHSALARVLYLQRGHSMIFAGHVAELVCLGIFAALTIVVTECVPREKLPNVEVTKHSRRLFWVISVVNALCLVRAAAKVVEASKPNHLLSAMVASGSTSSPTDTVPIMVAMAILSYSHLAQYLPEQVTNMFVSCSKQDWE